MESMQDMIATNSYLRRTGQVWKIWGFFGLLAAAGVMLLVGFSPLANNDPSSFTLFALSGACLGIIGLGWLAVSVRCSNCSSRLGWKAISSQAADGWLLWLLKTESCPVCKSKGATSA